MACLHGVELFSSPSAQAVKGLSMKLKDDYRSLRGDEKAAILLMSLPEQQAQQLFALMEDEEIKEISEVMANLGKVSSTVLERLFVEFAEMISATGTLVGSFESTERLLTKAVG